MIIAMPTQGPDATADFGRVFGRSPYFLFADTETGETTVEANPAADASGGAGIQAAHFVVDHKVEVVFAPHVGPKAQAVLDGAGIQVKHREGGTAQEALDAIDS